MLTVKEFRKEYGEGSLYMLKDGRFGTAISLGTKEDGSRDRIVRTAKTSEEAIRKALEELNRRRKEEAKARGEEYRLVITPTSSVSDLVNEYIKVKLVPNISIEFSSRTASDYLRCLRRFRDFYPENMVMSLEDVSQVNYFFDWMKNAKHDDGTMRFSQSSIDKQYLMVKAVLFRAVSKKWMTYNPLLDDDFRKPKSKKETKTVAALLGSELESLFAVIKKKPHLYPVMRLMLATGMRTEEVIALKWKDVNFVTGELDIQRAVTIAYDIDENGTVQNSHSVLAGSKTKGSVRKNQLDSETLKVLLEWRTWAMEYTKTKFGQEDFLFGNLKSERWTYHGLKASVNKLLEKEEFKDGCRFHQLRHTAGTLLGETATLPNVMKHLGHTQASTALRYMSVTDEIVESNGKILSGKLAALRV